VTPSRTITLLRFLFVTFSLFVGIWVGDVVVGSQWVGGAWGLIFGLLVLLADRLLRGFSLRVFSSATFGLLLGFVLSSLLLGSDVLRYTNDQTRWVISMCVYSAFGYLGSMLAIRSNRDEFSLIIPYIRFRRTAVQDAPIVVDTSILIDGRLIELCQTGFLSTSLVVPRFVLDELQRLADSAEPVKRERGRRGLDLLNEIRGRKEMSLTLHDGATDEETAVDTRLIQVAQILQARLLTNDSGLARVARLEGLTVLNLNELSRALQATILTGDELELTLIKPGRDSHQAVGYLPDGSMIVVNHARMRVGETVTVIIGGVFQTVSGQMYFAELKPGASHRVA
jgi:uncharacterized protein YacL